MVQLINCKRIEANYDQGLNNIKKKTKSINKLILNLIFKYKNQIFSSSMHSN